MFKTLLNLALFPHSRSFPPSLAHCTNGMERATAQVRRWQNKFCTRMGRWQRTMTKDERRGSGMGGRWWYEATVGSEDWDYSQGDGGVTTGNVFGDWHTAVEAVLFHALFVDVSSVQLWLININLPKDIHYFYEGLFITAKHVSFMFICHCTLNLQFVIFSSAEHASISWKGKRLMLGIILCFP